MEKRSRIIISILAIFLVISGTLAVYFAVNFKRTVNEVAINYNKIEDLNNKLEQVSDIENNEEIQANEKIVYKYTPDFENGKCLNAEENNIYTLTRHAEFQNYYIQAYVKDSGNNVQLSVEWNAIKNMFPKIKNELSGNKEYSINNFSSKVVDIYIYGWGQSVGYESLFFLMEDGTVEYMPIFTACKENNFKSYGKIAGIENIVDIVSGGVKYSIDDSGAGAGWASIFAINSDGNYYDIGKILMKTEYYDVY